MAKESFAKAALPAGAAIVLAACASPAAFHDPLARDSSEVRVTTRAPRSSGEIYNLPAAHAENPLGRHCSGTARIFQGYYQYLNVSCDPWAYADGDTMIKKQKALSGNYLSDVPIVDDGGVPTFDATQLPEARRVLMVRQHREDPELGVQCDVEYPVIQSRDKFVPLQRFNWLGHEFTNRDIANGEAASNFALAALSTRALVNGQVVRLEARMQCTPFTRETPMTPINDPLGKPPRHGTQNPHRP